MQTQLKMHCSIKIVLVDFGTRVIGSTCMLSQNKLNFAFGLADISVYHSFAQWKSLTCVEVRLSLSLSFYTWPAATFRAERFLSGASCLLGYLKARGAYTLCCRRSRDASWINGETLDRFSPPVCYSTCTSGEQEVLLFVHSCLQMSEDRHSGSSDGTL